MKPSSKLTRSSIFFLIAAASLPQGAFFGFNSTVMANLSSYGFLPSSSVVIMNFLRSAFFIGIALFSFLSRTSTRLLVPCCLLCSFACQLCLAFFSSDAILFLIFAALLFTLGGFLKPTMTMFVINQEDAEEGRKKSSQRIYVGVNVCCSLLELLTPIVYVRKGPRDAYLLLSLSSLVSITFAGFFLRRKESSKNQDHSSFSFFKVVKSFFHARSNAEAKNPAQFARLPAFVFGMSLFYTAFDQIFSSALTHTSKMNLNIFGFRILPVQAQLVNSALVVSFSAFLIRITEGKSDHSYRFKLAGIFCSVGFASMSALDYINDHMVHLSALFDIIPYALLTVAEIFVYTFAMETWVVSLKEEQRAIGLLMFYATGIIGNVMAAMMGIAWSLFGLEMNSAYFLVLSFISLMGVFTYNRLSYKKTTV